MSVLGSKMSGFLCKINGHLECPHICPKVHTVFFGHSRKKRTLNRVTRSPSVYLALRSVLSVEELETRS